MQSFVDPDRKNTLQRENSACAVKDANVSHASKKRKIERIRKFIISSSRSQQLRNQCRFHFTGTDPLLIHSTRENESQEAHLICPIRKCENIRPVNLPSGRDAAKLLFLILSCKILTNTMQNFNSPPKNTHTFSRFILDQKLRVNWHNLIPSVGITLKFGEQAWGKTKMKIQHQVQHLRTLER